MGQAIQCGRWFGLFTLWGAMVFPVAGHCGPQAPQDVISLPAARQEALKAQAGTVREGELEYEGNLWIYSFDIQGSDQKTHEVNIDARTGKIVGQSVETPADERREAKGEKAEGAGYRIVRRIPLAGDGGWDFLTLDGPARRLYVTHADQVQVLDADSLRPIGTLSGVTRPHGVVVLPELGKGYVSSGDPGSVVVFDLKSLKKIKEIPSRPDTDVILYDPHSKRIFTFNGDSHDATLIDPKTDQAVGSLDLGGAPEYAVSNGKGHLFDNLEDKSQVLRIDADHAKIEARWPLAPGESPSGMAFDAEHHRLFIGCRNKLLVVMNSRNGRVVETLPIGGHVDATVFDPASGDIFDSCGDGSLSVIHEDSPDRYHVVEDAATEPGARTMAFDPKTGRVFMDRAETEPLPAQEAGQAHHRPKIRPGTFRVLVLDK